MLAGTGSKARRGLSIYKYMMNCMEFPGGRWQQFWQVLAEVVFQHHFHVFVIGLVCIRVLQCFEFMPELSWFPLTMKIAAFKLGNFLVMYFMIVAGFSLVMHLSFGRLYTQYDSLTKSFFTLMLYSFGHADRAEQDYHPFIDTSGTELAIYLLLYTIVVVTIGMQFFTTIIL